MRASYKRAVEWIAMNDEDHEKNPHEMARLISVTMVADLWGRDALDVATAITGCMTARANLSA